MRTRAEVDAEIATFIRVAYGAGYFSVISGAVNFSSQLERLCSEPIEDAPRLQRSEPGGYAEPTIKRDRGAP